MKVTRLLRIGSIGAIMLLISLLCRHFLQARSEVELPDAEQVVKVTVDDTSTAAFFTPALLKKSLSRLRISKHQGIQLDVVGVVLQQSGTIILRNGLVFNWLASSADQIYISERETGTGHLYDVVSP